MVRSKPFPNAAPRFKNPGARGIEHATRETGCDLLSVATLLGVPLDELALVNGDTNASNKQSPLAFQAGYRFEAPLLGDDGHGILGLFREAGVLSPTECRVINLDTVDVTARA